MTAAPEHELGSLQREADVLDHALSQLRANLPPGWNMTTQIDVRLTSGRRADGLLQLAPPSGEKLTFIVEAKRLLSFRDVDPALRQLDAYRTALSREALPMLVARYLAPSVRRRLEEVGVSYLDATGNMLVAAERPGLLIRDHGADKDPWRGPGRPRGTLRGIPAARVVRALVDHTEPMPIRRLIEVSGASTGATYRVVDFLDEEGLVERTEGRRLLVPSWRKLLERWSQDYAFADYVADRRFLAPRGLGALDKALADDQEKRYVLTGSLAAHRWAPYAPARLGMIYVDNPADAATRWGLRPVDAGANVLLARTDSDVVYARSQIIDRVNTAAPSQVAVDLMTGPGRNPAEAQHLLEWMEAHEHAWRR